MQWAPPELWPLVIAGGFTVGLLVGLTGVGAGSLTTPFLITAIGVEPLVAVGTDLLFACLTKATAAVRHQKLGNVDGRILMWLAGGSLPAAAAVFVWLRVVPMDAKSVAFLIRQILAVALVVSAVSIALYPLLAKRRGQPDNGLDSDPAAPRPWPTLLLGIVIGATVALTSVGAGAIGVVALTALYPGLALRRLVGTDIVHAIPLTLIAGLGHLSLGHVDVGLLLTLLVGSVPGIALGSRLTGTLPDWTLRTVLAGVLLLAAFGLVAKGGH
jgi:uncharacterized membrane protein YfcA